MGAGGGCAGSLCVADTTPRDWGPDDLSVLEDLVSLDDKSMQRLLREVALPSEDELIEEQVGD